MKKLDKKETAKRLKQLRKAAAEGRVVIGNPAYMNDKGDGSALAWARNDEHGHYFGVNYSIPGFGFGGFTFEIVPVEQQRDPRDPEEPVIKSGKMKMVDSEAMGREFVKKVLCKMVDEMEWDHSEGKH